MTCGCHLRVYTCTGRHTSTTHAQLMVFKRQLYLSCAFVSSLVTYCVKMEEIRINVYFHNQKEVTVISFWRSHC